MNIQEAVERVKRLVRIGYSMSEACLEISKRSRISAEKLETAYVNDENN